LAIQEHLNSLLTRNPVARSTELIAELVPPREFSSASFENYFPNDAFPTQSQAKNILVEFSNNAKSSKLPGIYLDGGFGVGKTHLLAATFHAFKGKRKAYGSFIAFTALIGALGFANALKELKSYQFVAIDEFELDDPGNTMIMSRLINELAATGVRFAVTSNTPPNALGEGRFASADFQREILGIGRQFEMLRVDGEDYRHREFDAVHRSFNDTELIDWASLLGTVDSFDDVLAKLATVHPSLYSKLLDGVRRCALLGAHTLQSQNDGLRLVAFIDRAYELQVGLRSSGTPLTDIFPAEFIESGYKKKYLRAISRLGALVDLEG
jgi:cell division protein ZapE